jgi:hypothetical protein
MGTALPFPWIFTLPPDNPVLIRIDALVISLKPC